MGNKTPARAHSEDVVEPFVPDLEPQRMSSRPYRWSVPMPDALPSRMDVGPPVVEPGITVTEALSAFLRRATPEDVYAMIQTVQANRNPGMVAVASTPALRAFMRHATPADHRDMVRTVRMWSEHPNVRRYFEGKPGGYDQLDREEKWIVGNLLQSPTPTGRPSRHSYSDTRPRRSYVHTNQPPFRYGPY